MTTTVKRYDPEYYDDGRWQGKMEEDDYGDYVTYEDYNALQDEKESLEIELEKIKEAIKDLYYKT